MVILKVLNNVYCVWERIIESYRIKGGFLSMIVYLNKYEMYLF